MTGAKLLFISGEILRFAWNVRLLLPLCNRVRYAGARGRLTVRADSGFYAHDVAVCRKMDVRYSITIRQHKSLRSGAACQRFDKPRATLYSWEIHIH